MSNFRDWRKVANEEKRTTALGTDFWLKFVLQLVIQVVAIVYFLTKMETDIKWHDRELTRLAAEQVKIQAEIERLRGEIMQFLRGKPFSKSGGFENEGYQLKTLEL